MTIAETRDILAQIDEELAGHHEQAHQVSLDRAKAVFDLDESTEGEHVQRYPDPLGQAYYETQADWIMGQGPNPEPTNDPLAEILRAHIDMMMRALSEPSPFVRMLMERGRQHTFHFRPAPEPRTLPEIQADRVREMERIGRELSAIRRNSGVILSPMEQAGISEDAPGWTCIDVTDGTARILINPPRGHEHPFAGLRHIIEATATEIEQ